MALLKSGEQRVRCTEAPVPTQPWTSQIKHLHPLYQNERGDREDRVQTASPACWGAPLVTVQTNWLLRSLKQRENCPSSFPKSTLKKKKPWDFHCTWDRRATMPDWRVFATSSPSKEKGTGPPPHKDPNQIAKMFRDSKAEVSAAGTWHFQSQRKLWHHMVSRDCSDWSAVTWKRALGGYAHSYHAKAVF